MKISKTKNLKPFDRFLYWIKERHKIYLKKQAGEPKPWTDDEVLQNNFFTNPYRENDKVTVWFRKHIRKPLQNSDDVLMATVIFRWFNKPDPTGAILRGWKPAYMRLDSGGLKTSLLCKWDEAKAIERITNAWEGGKVPVFTGAYLIVAGSGPPGCKIPNVCKMITNVWKERKRLVKLCKDDCRLEALHIELCKFPYLGGFMAYEIVCDLRYTKLLKNASDILTWSNLGPGAARGLKRMNSLSIDGPKVTDWLQQFRELLVKVNAKLPDSMKQFELREIEHSLCEWDKYDRVLFGQGRSKRKYNGSK